MQEGCVTCSLEAEASTFAPMPSTCMRMDIMKDGLGRGDESVRECISDGQHDDSPPAPAGNAFCLTWS
jgi:hypothetical protein